MADKPKRSMSINKPSQINQHNNLMLGPMKGALRGSVRAQRIDSYLDEALGTSTPAKPKKKPSR